MDGYKYFKHDSLLGSTSDWFNKDNGISLLLNKIMIFCIIIYNSILKVTYVTKRGVIPFGVQFSISLYFSFLGLTRYLPKQRGCFS